MMMILTSCPFWNLRFRGNGASRVWQDADCVLCIALTIVASRESYYRKRQQNSARPGRCICYFTAGIIVHFPIPDRHDT